MRQTAQLDMFDRFTNAKDWNAFVPPAIQVARQKRDKGLKQVAGNNETFLKTMRGVARDICRTQGWVSADQLRAWADMNGVTPNHHNAWGVVLTTKEFVPGEYITSSQPQGHANRIRRWTLKSA